MPSLTQSARNSPSWRAVTALARLERLQRVSESRSPFRQADQRLLWLFSDREPRTLKGIADALGLEQSTVNRQVNAAVTAGAMRRFREPGHSAWLFLATESALEEFSIVLHRHMDVLEAALTAIPAAQRGVFFDQLEDFVKAYDDALTAAHLPG